MSKSIKNVSKAESTMSTILLSEISKNFRGEHSIRDFIDTTLTEGEKLNLTRRLLIAQLILRGETYYSVDELLHVSPNTFSKIRKWTLEQIPEYSKITKPKERAKMQRSDWPKTFSYAWLQKKYPAHFLLFTISEHLISKLKSK